MGLAAVLPALKQPARHTVPLVVLALTGITAAPVLVLALALMAGPGPSLAHLAATVLPEVLVNTFGMSVLVALGTAFTGTVCAWLVTAYRFPAVRLFDWMLLLPLAMPTYIIGYVYTDALAYAGPVQSALRGLFGWSRGDYWFPDIHSLPGVSAVLVLVLYPYVYLSARASFLEQASGMLEAARTLGHSQLAVFVRIALPLARPAIMAGVALALMEALADFATVQYFGMQTFTTLIYRTWIGMGDRVTAAQLAVALLAFVLALLYVERASRRAMPQAARTLRRVSATQLRGWQGLAALVTVSLPVLLGFILPFIYLVRLHLDSGDPFFGNRFVTYTWNSLYLAALSVIVLLPIAGYLVHQPRISNTPLIQALIRIASGGYAVPGTVIAIGVLIVLGLADLALAALLGHQTGLLLSGSVMALLYAYLVRFLAVAAEPVAAGYARIPTSIDQAAATLGASRMEIHRRVLLPQLRRPFLVAALMVFVEVLKELPATLIVRPFNFDTLAVRVYSLASDERLAQASTGAILLVITGLLPVFILSRMIARQGQESTRR